LKELLFSTPTPLDLRRRCATARRGDFTGR
jgi:hypothetical protein